MHIHKGYYDYHLTIQRQRVDIKTESVYILSFSNGYKGLLVDLAKDYSKSSDSGLSKKGTLCVHVEYARLLFL